MIFPEYTLYFLACYGICFGFMFKATIFHKRHDFFDKMFKCAYCTGFWAGMLAWMFVFAPYFVTHTSGLSFVGIMSVFSHMISHMFASSIFCYIIDTVMQKVEGVGQVQYSQQIEEYDEESEYEEVSEDEDVEQVEMAEYAEKNGIDLENMNPMQRLRLQAMVRAGKNG